MRISSSSGEGCPPICASNSAAFAFADLLFVAFSTYHQDAEGQVFVFFSMAVAAAEVAVGLAILVSVFRNLGSIDIDNLKNLKG